MATIALNSSQGRWTMTACILASSIAFIDGTALNVVLPSLQKSLQADAAALFWILNAYLLVLAAFILTGGSLGDKLGRKKIFMWGILAFIAGSVACGFAPSVNALIVCRALQGLGGACMIPGSLSIISSSFNEQERGKAIGTWSAVTTMVTVGGPILGGAFADAGLWRYIFFINAPIGVASLLILWFKVAESRDQGNVGSIDYAGAISIVAALALLTFAFLRIPALGFNGIQVLISLGLGVALLIAFIVIESKSKSPMMPLQLFKNRTFSGANLLTLFLYSGLSGGMLFLTLNMVQVQGYSQLAAGFTLLPFTILMIVIARRAGALSDKYGPKWLLVLGPATAGAGMLMLSFVSQTSGPAAYWSSFFPGILVFGLGMSFTVAPLTATVMGALKESYSGTASGINNAITRIAAVFANAVFGALAIGVFASYLQGHIAGMHLPQSLAVEVMKEAANLGNATVPEDISTADKTLLVAVYKQSFIAAYGVVMRVCGILALAGAVMSLIFIKNIKKKIVVK